MADVSVLKLNGVSYNIKDAKKYFPNIASMKSKASLVDGDICYVLGRSSEYDSGGGTYQIVSVEPSSPYVYESLDNGYYARLIPFDNVNVKSCGAAGDGVTDDTASINKAMALAYELKKEVYFPAGQYYISSTIEVPEGIGVRGIEVGFDYDESGNYYSSALDRASVIVSGSNITMLAIGKGTSISFLAFYYTSNLPTLTTTAINKPTIATSVYRNGVDPLSTDTTIHDCFLINGFCFFSSTGGGKLRIYNIKIDCTGTAISIKRSYDSCYIDNIHLWSFYFSGSSNMYTNYIASHRTMFYLEECDDVHISSCFGYGGKFGVRCLYPSGDTTKGVWVLIDGCSFDYFETTISAVYAKHITVNNSHIMQSSTANSVSAVYLENCPLAVFSDLVFYWVNNCFMISNSEANLSNIKCDPTARNLFLTYGSSTVNVSNCDKNFNVFGKVNNIIPSKAAVIYPVGGGTTTFPASTSETTVTIPLTYVGPCCLSFTCPTASASTVTIKIGTNDSDKLQRTITLGANARGTYNIPLFFYPGAASLHGSVNVFVTYKTAENAPITNVQVLKLGNVNSSLFSYFNAGYTNYAEYCSNYTYDKNSRVVFPVETPSVSYFTNGDMYVGTNGKIYTRVNGSWLN